MREITVYTGMILVRCSSSIYQHKPVFGALLLFHQPNYFTFQST